MNRSRAVVTLAIGDFFKRMGAHTHPLLERYAEKCDADFIVLDTPFFEQHLGLVTYEKFQLYGLLDGRYEQVLFVDTDVVVLPTSPDVFAICPANHFGASNEEKYSMAGKHKELTQAQLGSIVWTAPYFNSGVMLVSPAHRAIFDPNGADLQKWVSHESNTDHVMSDQPILNYLVNKCGTPFIDLGPNYNRTRVLTDTHRRFRSHFIHYAGPSGHRYGNKLEQIAADASIAQKPLQLWMSRSLPPARWVSDRLSRDFGRYLSTKIKQKMGT